MDPNAVAQKIQDAEKKLSESQIKSMSVQDQEKSLQDMLSLPKTHDNLRKMSGKGKPQEETKAANPQN